MKCLSYCHKVSLPTLQITLSVIFENTKWMLELSYGYSFIIWKRKLQRRAVIAGQIANSQFKIRLFTADHNEVIVSIRQYIMRHRTQNWILFHFIHWQQTFIRKIYIFRCKVMQWKQSLKDNVRHDAINLSTDSLACKTLARGGN